MAIPGFFPVQVTGADLACPTVGAGLGASITQLSISVWTCTAGLQFNSSDGTIVPPGGGGFYMAVGGGGPIPETPGNVGGVDTLPQVLINAQNHSPAATPINDMGFSGGAGQTLCYDQTDAAGVRYASSLEVHFLVAVDFIAQRIQVWCNDSLLPLSSGAWGPAVAWNNAALNWTLLLAQFVHAGDFWVVPTYIDWSVQANRRQFINADLSAVQLPSNGHVTVGGSTITPAIYLRVDPTGAASDFLANRGTGPNWTVSSGSLVIARPGDPGATSSCMGVQAPGVPLTPPDTVCASNNSTTAINPTWGAVAGAISYTLQYAPANSGLWTPISGITGTSYVVEGLDPNTGYDWQVQAVGPGGASAWSATTTCQTQTPQPTTTVDPQRNLVWLDWSDDGGHYFSDPISQSLGATGHYGPVVQFNRLGFGRSRVWRITWTSPVKTVLQGAWVEVTPGKS